MTALVTIVTVVWIVAFSAPLARRSTRPVGDADADRARVRRRNLRGKRRERVLDAAYPDALDLLVVSVQAGHLPLEALMRIRPHVHPTIAIAIDAVARRMDGGQRFAEALGALVDHLGTRALALASTIRVAERTGLAAAPMIDRIGDDARLHRRRRAEIAARELPVRLALPLVLCTLPSFVLLAIAPLLIGALSSLRGI